MNPQTPIGTYAIFQLIIILALFLNHPKSARAADENNHPCGANDICKEYYDSAMKMAQNANLTPAEQKAIQSELFRSSAESFGKAFDLVGNIQILYYKCKALADSETDHCAAKRCYFRLTKLINNGGYFQYAYRSFEKCNEPEVTWFPDALSGSHVGETVMMLRKQYSTWQDFERERTAGLRRKFPHKHRMWRAGLGISIGGGIVALLGMLAFPASLMACFPGDNCSYVTNPIDGERTWYRSLSESHRMASDMILGIGISGFAIVGLGGMLLQPYETAKKNNEQALAKPLIGISLPMGKVTGFIGK